MVTNKIFKLDGTVKTLTYENNEYFERIGITQESLINRVRIKRNQLLQQTDWRATVDYPNPDKQAWLDYRQALRDLPETADPQLDENGQLINIVWPEEPQ